MSEYTVGAYIFYGENTSDGHNKFWAIQKISTKGDVLNGKVLVTWGKIGTKGQSQIVDEDEAYRRQSEKLMKGYVSTMTTTREVPKPKPKKEKVDTEELDFMDELRRIV